MSRRVTEALKQRTTDRGHGLFENPIGDYIRHDQARRWGLPWWEPPKLTVKPRIITPEEARHE